ncbi:phage tail protein [Sphaerotilus microaerophilus]|uniref:Phage tail protein n=1 Tax=Sphaerotilus microaerophilus TaxID=2914710 RepID=A0ABN6PPA3_9BURK|nr:phage tail protein [Sphaerotilus sp. FB-5]BDI05902.1 phage tail protein [Sphaerotilus sp. FB-5]
MATRIDPSRTYNFLAVFIGLGEISFSEISGIAVDSDVVDYREGNERFNNVRKLPGLRKFANLTFRRGYTPDDRLWQWYARLANGANERYNGSIVLLNEARKPVMRWNFVNAFITKIDGPMLKAAGNEIAIEAMDIAHEGLTMELESQGA